MNISETLFQLFRWFMIILFATNFVYTLIHWADEEDDTPSGNYFHWAGRYEEWLRETYSKQKKQKGMKT